MTFSIFSKKEDILFGTILIFNIIYFGGWNPFRKWNVCYLAKTATLSRIFSSLGTPVRCEFIYNYQSAITSPTVVRGRDL